MSSKQIEDLKKRLNAIPKAVRDAVKPALDKSADELVSRIQTLVPDETGDLYNTIHKEPGDHELQVKVIEGSATAPATHVEYGHLTPDGKGHVEAVPHFWPAVRLTKTRIKRRLDRAMSKAIKDEWGK